MIGILRAVGALVFDLRPSVDLDRDGSSKPQPAEQYRCTVLAIDDDPTFFSILRPLLREQGFNVLTATSGAKGLDMLRYASRDIRVVLLDYNMPQLNGVETLQYVRKLNPDVKVIALTGVDINLLPESFREGVDKFIQKPFRCAELVAAINELVGTPAPTASQS